MNIVPPSFRTVEADGASADARRSVYVLHGIFASGRSWRSVARRLAEARPDLRMVLVDLHGHGESLDAAPPHTLERCAHELRALHAVTGPPVAVIGHSFGGKVAMVHSEGFPVETWVLDSPPGRTADCGEANRVLEALRALPEPFESRTELDRALNSAEIAPAVITWMQTNVDAAPGGGLRFRFRRDVMADLLADYRRTDCWPSALSAASPIVHVRGTRSDRWDPENWARFRTLPPLATLPAPGSSSIELDAGHWVHIDAGEPLLALLIARLARPRD
ncbi:MAG: alpha/beta hydrolase [Myxococcales bacterium]|nr:alpha/beta hydrolase [Myxococcales bacterium]